MITRGERWRARADHARRRYEAWEARRLARLSGWPVRRRYTVLVLLPVLLCCCGTTVVGAPLGWVLRETVSAGKGAASPDAAASEYLMALGYGQEDGLLPLLDDEHQDELLAQWRAYRAQMAGTDPAPSRLNFGALAVSELGQDQAVASTDVSALWWTVDANGRNVMYQSDEHPWRITSIEDDGWRVSAVEAPAWCGAYVLAEKCTP